LSIPGHKALSELLHLENKSLSILDIGCGKDQLHVKEMKKAGFTNIYTCDFFDDCDYKGKFTDIEFDRQFDVIWCSHCLEHQPNPNLFLSHINSVLKENGTLFITVPPLKHKIVGGHLTLWNTGLLYYNLILAGFNCKNGKHSQYGYNISVIVNKKTITDMPTLFFDNGDIELLSKYFPFKAVQGFNGNELPNTF
jgi:SAM-dependent methyltransferase